MKKESFTIGLIAVLAFLAVAYFGISMYTDQQRSQALSEIAPPPAWERFEKLASDPVPLDKSPREEPSPDVPIPTQRDIEYERETIALYAPHFVNPDDNSRRDGIRELHERLSAGPLSMLSPGEIAELEILLAEHEELLTEIRLLAERGGPVYPLALEDGIAMLLPHLAPMRDFARLLAASAALEANRSDFDAATRDLLAGMQLADALSEEPVVISQLVRMAMYRTMAESIYYGFPQGQLPPELASNIVAHTERAANPQALANSMRNEQYTILEYFTSDNEFELLDGFWGDDLPSRAARFVYESPIAQPWRNMDATSYAEISSRIINTVPLPYHEALPLLNSINEDVDALPNLRVSTRALLPALSGITRAQARYEVQLDLVQIGLSLESHRQQYGNYPDSLDAISHELPTDPHSGQPYRYESLGNTFILYGVGENLTDNGGLHDSRNGDIVWRGQEPAEKRASEEREKMAAVGN